MTGWNDCGQLGTGTNENQFRFKKFDFTRKVTSVSCGWNHTLLLDGLFTKLLFHGISACLNVTTKQGSYQFSYLFCKNLFHKGKFYT